MLQQHQRTRRRKKRKSRTSTRSARVRSATILGCIAAVAFVVGLFSFSSAHRALNDWREGRLTQEASDDLRRGNIDAAEQAARKVIDLDPSSLSASRVLAEVTEKQNRSETVAWRSQIARLAPSFETELNLASAALRFGQLDLARTALDRVRPEERDQAPYYVVAGWLARAQGDVASEENHFSAAVAREPSNDLYQFNLAVLQIHSPDPHKSDSARAQLQRLSKLPEFHTGAVRSLLEDAVKQNQIATAESLAQDLQMSPEVSFSDYLLCLDFYRKLNPKKFNPLLAKIKPVAARNPDDLAQLIDWMNNHALETEALKWSEKLSPDVTNRPPAAIAIADSMAATKNWSRLKRWTRSGSWGEQDYLWLAYQSYAVRESRHAAGDAESTALWASAREAAEDHPEEQLALARLATKWKLTQEAEDLWQMVAKVSSNRREALDALFDIYRQGNDLPNLRLTAQRLHESSPGEVGLAVNAARLSLLLDHNTAEGRKLAEEAYGKAPADRDAAVTYAFALYGTGRTSAALDVLKKLSPDDLRDPHVAVYAALLYDDDNQISTADGYIKLAQAGLLFPEEKQLLEEITTHRQTASPAPSPSPTSPTPRAGKSAREQSATPAPAGNDQYAHP